MEIKRSDLILDKFTMLAFNITSIPSEKKMSIDKLKDIPIDLDFDILRNKKNSSKVQIILEINSNQSKKPLSGYSYSIVCSAEYSIKSLAKREKKQQDQYILFTALPLAIAMVRSHLYNTSSNFLHGHYLLPSIDLPDLFNKKFVENE